MVDLSIAMLNYQKVWDFMAILMEKMGETDASPESPEGFLLRIASQKVHNTGC